MFVTSCGSEDKKAIANTTPAISVKVANVTEQQNSSYLSVSGKTQAVTNKDADVTIRMFKYFFIVGVCLSLNFNFWSLFSYFSSYCLVKKSK